MYRDLTKGSIAKGLTLFALPMILGNLLQQFYNIADTLIVGQVLGKNDLDSLKSSVAHALNLILSVTIIINIAVYVFFDKILLFLQIPGELYAPMKEYLIIIYSGLLATSLYNFFSCLLRSVGNSVAPLWFLGTSAILNILLDLLFVITFNFGISGAAVATVISQYISGIGILIYTVLKSKEFMPKKRHFKFNKKILFEILDLSVLTCAQQSAMNFGILLIQRLVDSFGAITMAAFAAAVKIDTFAYLPVQDFGNAFSTFVAQNYGAKQTSRLKEGFKKATLLSALFSLIISALVFAFANPLMRIFINQSETDVILSGVKYLRIEGAFYIGIGCLFLLYGFYRAVKRPGMSVVLTVISLGTRVVLAYVLANIIGKTGIWISIPIGWVLADIIGYGFYFIKRKRIFNF